MPSRNVTVQPYEIPGGSANTEVAVSWELVDANGAPQLGYDEILGDGVAGAYATVVRDTAVTVPLQLTTGLVPPLYWRFKAQWGSLTGYRSYTSGYIPLDAGVDLTLPEFLDLEEIPTTITGLTTDEIAAIRGAASPSATNVFATMDDITAGVAGVASFEGRTGVVTAAAGDYQASEITVDASGFNGNLAVTDDTVQKIAQKVDDLVTGAPDLSGYVTKATYDANTILAATADNTPAALTVAEQTLVGRITGGAIDDLSASQVRTLLNVADGSTAAGVAGDAYATSHESDVTAHPASSIVNTPAGNIVAVTVQAAINELDTEKVAKTVLADIEDPTGFLNPESIDVAYSTANRTITLTGTLEYYWKGTKVTLTSPWTSSAHATGDGVFYLSSTDGTTFAWSITPWSFDHIQVARITVADSGTTVFGQREPHGVMPFSVHQVLHSNIGTWRESGLTLDPATYTVNTASDAATTPGFLTGVVVDEDLETTIPAWAEDTYTTVRIGAASAAVFDVAATFPFRSSGSFILVNTPSTGTEAPTVNNRYVNIYQLVVPVTSDTDSQKYRMLMLQPQVAYTSLAAAQAEDPRGLVLGSLTSLAAELVFHARITYVTATGDANTGKCRIATGGVTYLAGGRASQVSISGYTVPIAANVAVAATPSNYTAATPDVEAHLVGLDAVAHAAVTLAGTPDYITISGQQITRNAVDLAADVTGTLPVANGGTGGSSLPKLDDLTAPDDNTDLNASTTAHGLSPKAVAPASGSLSALGIGNGETARVDKVIFQGCLAVRVLTAAEYAALSPPVSTTLYFRTA